MIGAQDFEFRIMTEDDVQNYYDQNFTKLDEELVRLTGSKESYSYEEVKMRVLSRVNQRHYIVITKENRILGEVVISDIDEVIQSAHLRIAIFNKDQRGQGLGTLMMRKVLKEVFEVLKLHRLELEVYSFNPRAIQFYESIGFYHEGRLRDSIKFEGVYADTILMSILLPEYQRSEFNLL